MDDRERAPDGHNHVGNGALARAAARNGSNGADPVLEEMVSTWRRRVSGNPSDEETGTDEPPVARGRAEVPGPPFANDPADVNRVPFIPQQPMPQQILQQQTPQPPMPQPPNPQQPPPPPPVLQSPTFDPPAFRSPPFEPPNLQMPSFEPPTFQTPVPQPPTPQPPRHQDESAHHFPSVSEQPAEPDEDTGSGRRSERHSYDERIRYQRPFRFRQRSDEGPQHGRAEAQFGPAEFGPPEYRPPEPSRPWQPEHRNTGPEFGHHSAAQGVAPRSPAPFGVPDVPAPPVSPAPPADSGATPPYGVAPPGNGNPNPQYGGPPPNGSSGPPYGVASPGEPFTPPPPADPYAASGPAEPATTFGGPGYPSEAPSGHRATSPEPTTSFEGSTRPIHRNDGSHGATIDPPRFTGRRSVRPTSSPPARSDPPRPAASQSVGPQPDAPQPPAAQHLAPEQMATEYPAPEHPASQQPIAQQPIAQQPVAPQHPAQQHAAEGHPAERHSPRQLPVEPHPAEPHTGPPHTGQPLANQPHTGQRHTAERHTGQQHTGQQHYPGQQPTPAEAARQPVVPAPLIPPYQGTVPPSADTAPPLVPPPLIPPVSPAAERLWSGGPWSDGSWSAGASPSVGWQTEPVSGAGPTYPYTPEPSVDGPLPPPPPPIPTSGAFDGPQAPTDLPQRVPSAPDVPAVPGSDGPDGTLDEAPADLSRIADFFRNEEPAEERRDGFDFPAVIDAVQGVVGVREAEIVNIDGRHTLRLDLSDDADPGEVSRAVARLLKEQMGVSAEPARPPSGAEVPVEEVGRSAPEEPDAMPVPRPIEQNSAADTRRAPNAAPAGAATRGERAVVGEAVEPAPLIAAHNPEVTGNSTPTEPPRSSEPTGLSEPSEPSEPSRSAGPSEPPELSEPTGMSEPPELAPSSDPVPPRLADLPRVGEPPTAADSVRFGSVPRRSGPPSPRAGSRPSDARPLRVRLADIEPDLSFEAWLEAIRPGATRSARNPEERALENRNAEERNAENRNAENRNAEERNAEEPRDTGEPPSAEEEPEAEEREHHSLVGMPMAPVFADPTEPQAEAEGDEEDEQPEDDRRALEPVSAHRDPVPELGLPNAPAFQFAGSGGRVRLEQVDVNSHGLDAEVQVRLSAGGTGAVGHAVGPAVDGYMLRLSATATAGALDALLTDPDSGTRIGRCYIEHATVVPLGTCEIALVVMLIVSGGIAEQLSGSAIVAGDVRQAVVRATLAAANRRLDALLP